MNQPRVLVTDTGDRAGVDAVRSLAAAGYRVTAAATNRKAPGLWSRGSSSRQIIPDPRDGLDAFVARLSQIVREDAYDILIPVRDETLYAVSARREAFDPYVETGLPEHEVVERALDKTFLAEQATKVGLGPPESHLCTDAGQALEVAEMLGFPVVVKGPSAIVEVEGRVDRFPSRFVTSESELREAQERIGTCIVQRRQLGQVLSFGGVVTERGLLASAVSRYHRTWPPIAGYAAFTETIDPPGALAEQVEALMAAMGWRGIFELELIEGTDGSIGAIDFNPRLYGSICLATRAGAPLTAIWCDWLRGKDPKPVRARVGIRYRHEEGDARHIAWQLRTGDYRGAGNSMMPRRGVVHPYARIRDPLPTLYLGAVIARQLTQSVRRLASRG
jgi:predicted ATP-grasp superfamily ATP-dependent carboligase